MCTNLMCDPELFQIGPAGGESPGHQRGSLTREHRSAFGCRQWQAVLGDNPRDSLSLAVPL